MGALAGDRLVRKWWQNAGPTGHKRPYASQNNLAANVKVWIGAVCLGVDGVARPLVSGSELNALATLFGGAGANNGLYARARAPHVRLALVASGNNSAESVTISYGATTDITVNLSTDGMGSSTSTPNSIAQSIRRHAEANRLLAVDVKGTGADVIGAVAATAVAHLEVLGVACERLETVSTGAALTLRPSVSFDVGAYGMVLSGPAPNVGAWVSLVNDAEIAKATDGLDFQAPLVGVEGGLWFVDLAMAR